MRHGFREIADDWVRLDDLDEVTGRIVALARWLKANGGTTAMEPDETATFRSMVEFQITSAVRAGIFEPQVAADADDAEIADIFSFDGP